MNLEALDSILKPRISIEEIKAQDEHTFREMFEENVLLVEYEDLAGKRLLDVGSYMGFFSMLAIGMEAIEVVAVEANRDNFAKLKDNALRFDNILPVHCAVFDGSVKSARTIEDSGISKVLPDGDVKAVGLGDLLALFPSEDDNLVLKLDTEGSEYDILMNASGRELRRFEIIFLETHQTPHLEQKPARKAQFLRDYLDMVGFKVDKDRFIYNWKEDGKGGFEWYVKVEDQESVKLKRR